MQIVANIVIGITVVVLMLLLCISYARSESVCMDVEARERVRALVLEGIDQGLKMHAQHMFEVWMKDPTKQPARALAGMRTGIIAYNGARAAAQRWRPPLCR
jgi:uncharacterized MAPEG superfamily protein